MEKVDFLVIGAGIAGASVGYELSKSGSVAVLDMEHSAGYHTTGRSASIISINYVSPIVECMGAFSREFFLKPPDGFCDHALTAHRQSLWVARQDQIAAYDQMLKEAQERSFRVDTVSIKDCMRFCPVLREEALFGGLLELDTLDLDVNAIHHGYLRGIRARGSRVILDAKVNALQQSNGIWSVKSSAGDFQAPVVVNAAGAWCDKIAELANCATIGLQPKLRTAFTFEAPSGTSSNSWPFLYDMQEQFYFKLENQIVLASAFDEIDSPPCDATPDHYDIALAIDRIQKSTVLDIKHIKNKWAGLRSFAPDRELVVGADLENSNFFWLAGQGGVGIMTAPASSITLAEMIVNQSLPSFINEAGIKAEHLSPQRFLMQKQQAV